MSAEIIEHEEWTCSANEALNVSIAEPTKAITFKPKFTYPIFGDSEQIFGYKDLRIDLVFDCESLKPLLTYKYSEKLSKDIKPIEETFSKFLPIDDYIFNSESKWLDSIEEEKFQLPKENIVYSYDRIIDNKINTFDIYKFKLFNDDNNNNNNFEISKKLFLRIQILILLYIEAGSYINLNDKGWELYMIYNRNENEGKNIFIGFCTCYKYWKFEKSEEYDKINDIENESEYRCRLSQMIILPPFQNKGHGKEIYSFITNEWHNDKRCYEITIEDPNEEFDDLRDKCDLIRIIENENLIKDLKELPISKTDKLKLKNELKFTNRQFERIIEMGLFWILNHYNDKEINNLIKGFKGEETIRLMIKKRVYLNNKEGLEALNDNSLVKSKLEEVYDRVARDYKKKARDVDREFNNNILDSGSPATKKQRTHT